MITLVEGDQMDLVVDGVAHALGLHESFSFVRIEDHHRVATPGQQGSDELGN